MAVTITTTVNSSNYAAIFASVDTAKMLIEEAGTTEITTGKLHLESGWTFIGNLYIQATVPQLIPVDLTDPSLYTLAIDDAIVIVTDNAGSNRINGGGIYVKRGDLRYTNASDQYQFGGFSSSVFPYFNVNGLRMHTDGGRFLFNNNKSAITSVTNDLQFTGSGKVELNVIWGSDLNKYTPPYEADNIVGIERFPASVTHIGEDGTGTGNNFTYFNEWIFNKVAGVTGPSLGVRDDINVIVNDPLLNDGQVVTCTRINSGHVNQWVEVRRSFIPKFINTSLAPIEGVKLYIDNTTESLFQWMSNVGRTVYTTLEDANLAGGFKTDYDYKTGQVVSSLSTGLLDDGGKCWYRVAKWKEGVDAISTPVVDFTGTPTAYSFKYGFIQVNIPLSNTEKTELSVTGVVDANIILSKAAADALTVFSNDSEIYDRTLAFYEDNFGTYLTPLISAIGVYGAINLILNATAGTPYAYSNTGNGTITVKSAAAFTGGYEGTGNTTVQNGTLLNGGAFDCDVNIDNNSEADTYTNVVIDKLIHTGTGTRTLTLDGGTVTELEVTGGADLTVSLLNGATVTTSTETSGTITLVQNVSILDAALIDGTRVQLWNITKGAELDNSVVSGGGGYSYNVNLLGAAVDDGDTLRIRATYQSGVTAKLSAEASGIVSTTGLTFLLTQEADTIYDTIGLDGSLITKFTADYINDEVDIVTASDFLGTELYSRFIYFETTEEGIRNFFRGFMAVDIANYKNDVTVLDLFLNNNAATNLKQTDNVRLYKSNGVYPVRNPTTGGGGVDVVWRSQVYVADTSIAPTVQEVVDGVWDEVIDNANHNTAKSAGKRLRQAGTSLAVEGSVNDPTPSTSSFITDLVQGETSFYADQTCIFVSGDLEGQARIITSYNSVTKVLTFDEPWTIAPADTDEFEIKADHVHPVSQIQAGLATETNATTNKNSIITEVAANETKIDLLQVDSTDIKAAHYNRRDLSGTTATIYEADDVTPKQTFTIVESAGVTTDITPD